ncbi:MAG: hypothetical protein KDH17_18900 [Rhodocyclaceae bacterium]|nr:hypothetical protein [Rhodocyclaceae bacterium]
MLLSKRDLAEAWRATVDAFTWPLFGTLTALVLIVGGLFWLGGHADPRYQSSCSDPGDTAFLMFFLAIPVVGVCGLVGLGEGVQWGRLRGDHPRQAREHLNHAATLLGIAFTVCIVTGLGLLKLCRVF